MKDYIIREIRSNEIPLLSDFLYAAIFQRDENNLLPPEIINQPELKIYIDNFGKHGDYCLAAEISGKIAGAVWTRILCGNIKGYGNINETTPEFAVSLYREYRGKGIGKDLMKSMLRLLKEKGYKCATLAVQKDNYAVKMYPDVGFKIIKEVEEEYIMMCNMNNENIFSGCFFKNPV